VVYVRYDSPVSPLAAVPGDPELMTHRHEIAPGEVRDEFGNFLASPLPAVIVEPPAPAASSTGELKAQLEDEKNKGRVIDPVDPDKLTLPCYFNCGCGFIRMG